MIDNFIPQNQYKDILEKVPICCIDMIIEKEGKVLLMKRKNQPAKGKWWVPGGRVLKNESLKDAVRRKAKEETGLIVDIKRCLGVYEFFDDKTPFASVKTGTHTIMVVYLVKPETTKIQPDSQHESYKWVSSIPSGSHPYIKRILEDSKIFC